MSRKVNIIADTLIIGGVIHTKANKFKYHNKPTVDRLHPLGEIYTTSKGKFGYVANGYDWWKFPLSELDNIGQTV